MNASLLIALSVYVVILIATAMWCARKKYLNRFFLAIPIFLLTGVNLIIWFAEKESFDNPLSWKFVYGAGLVALLLVVAKFIILLQEPTKKSSN